MRSPGRCSVGFILLKPALGIVFYPEVAGVEKFRTMLLLPWLFCQLRWYKGHSFWGLGSVIQTKFCKVSWPWWSCQHHKHHKLMSKVLEWNTFIFTFWFHLLVWLVTNPTSHIYNLSYRARNGIDTPRTTPVNPFLELWIIESGWLLSPWWEHELCSFLRKLLLLVPSPKIIHTASWGVMCGIARIWLTWIRLCFPGMIRG